MGFVGCQTVGVDRLGRYTVLRHLASGGMADVLLARADGEAHQIAGFERHVVVKRIKAEHAKDKRFIQMFLDEARLAATLHHQNVVQVHDIGEEHGEYFFAMEYLHGEDLRKLLSTVSKQRKHLPLGNVLAIISAAAAGLHYAHERRDNNKKRLEIVHRDVSPSNIVVGYDGSVKVLDFGIAKAAMRTAETRTGTLKGKVSYMSPEQCKGVQVVDRRSDVYSLGVVFYELATTSRLFKAESDYLVQDAIVNGKIPLPRIRRPDLPNELQSIILKALAVDPARRYQTAEELQLAIDELAESAKLGASASALATYMKKLFGEKPEPWQETGQIELVEARASWNDLAAADMTATGDGDSTALSEPPTTANRKPTVPPPMITPGAARTASQAQARVRRPSSVSDTRTSTRMAWQYEGDAPVVAAESEMKLSTKVLLMLGPVALVAGGLIVMRMMDSSSTTSEKKEPIVVTARAPVPVPAPEPQEVAAPVPAPTIVARLPPPPPPPVPTRAPNRITATAAAPPTPAPATPVEPAPAPVTPPPTIAAPPPEKPPAEPIAPVVPMLSQATVSLVAGDHGPQLAKCEGTEPLHGDVTITFEINGAGRVTTSQLNSTIHNIKVAACVLSALKSWPFPKPPSGAAKGVYTISYQ